MYPYHDGKWMMFFPLHEMDRRWAEACYLYTSGLLYGINSLKASTAKQNPMPERLHGLNEGIIIFYCGPSESEWNVMEYGRNILNRMNYPRNYFFYKSDMPHLINYYKTYRHLYYIDTLEHYRNRLVVQQKNNLAIQKRNYSNLSNLKNSDNNLIKSMNNRNSLSTRNIISPIFRNFIF